MVVQLFIREGVDPNIKSKDGGRIFSSLFTYYKHDNLFDLVRFLIEKGEDVNAESIGGWTPLFTLCVKTII